MSRKSRLKAMNKRRGKKGRRRSPSVQPKTIPDLSIPMQEFGMDEESTRRAKRPVIERDPSVPSGGVDLLEEL